MGLQQMHRRAFRSRRRNSGRGGPDQDSGPAGGASPSGMPSPARAQHGQDLIFGQESIRDPVPKMLESYQWVAVWVPSRIRVFLDPGGTSARCVSAVDACLPSMRVCRPVCFKFQITREVCVCCHVANDTRLYGMLPGSGSKNARIRDGIPRSAVPAAATPGPGSAGSAARTPAAVTDHRYRIASGIRPCAASLGGGDLVLFARLHVQVDRPAADGDVVAHDDVFRDAL